MLQCEILTCKNYNCEIIKCINAIGFSLDDKDK